MVLAICECRVKLAATSSVQRATLLCCQPTGLGQGERRQRERGERVRERQEVMSPWPSTSPDTGPCRGYVVDRGRVSSRRHGALRVPRQARGHVLGTPHSMSNSNWRAPNLLEIAPTLFETAATIFEIMIRFRVSHDALCIMQCALCRRCGGALRVPRQARGHSVGTGRERLLHSR